jgi:hypothetical protein
MSFTPTFVAALTTLSKAATSIVALPSAPQRWKTTSVPPAPSPPVVGGVLVVEAPGAEDLEAGLFGGGEAEFDVCLVVVEGEVLEELTLSACVCGSFWLAGWLLSKCCGGFRTHVGVAAGEVEVFAVQFELCSGGRHEAFRGFAGRKSCYCAYKQGDGGEVDQHLVVRRSRASE